MLHKQILSLKLLAMIVYQNIVNTQWVSPGYQPSLAEVGQE